MDIILAKASHTCAAVANVNLSERERRILGLASEGMIDKEIASHLNIRLATVRTYWERLRVKLSAANRTHAIALALPHLLEIERDNLRKVEDINRFIIRTIEEVAIFTCDAKGVVVSWNMGVERVLGYREEEWIGQTPHVLFVPEDVQRNDPENELLEAADRGISVSERWHVRRDGSRFWGVNTVIPFNHEFHRPGFAKIIQDRSEIEYLKKRIEELEAAAATR